MKPDAASAISSSSGRGIATRYGQRVVGDPEHDVAAGGEVLQRDPGDRDVERRHVRRGQQERSAVAVHRDGGGVERGRLVGVSGRDGGRPPPRAAAQRVADLRRPLRAQQRCEPGIGRGAERVDDHRRGISPS